MPPTHSPLRLEAAILSRMRSEVKLGKRQEHVQGKPAHRGSRIELLSDRHKRHMVRVEQLHQFREVRQRTGQTVDLVDDDHVDPSGPDVLKEPLQGRPLGIAA